MANYEVPETMEKRYEDLRLNIQKYQEQYDDFKEKGKKASGQRAKLALTIVKKLITAVRKDIQKEMDEIKK